MFGRGVFLKLKNFHSILIAVRLHVSKFYQVLKKSTALSFVRQFSDRKPQTVLRISLKRIRLTRSEMTSEWQSHFMTIDSFWNGSAAFAERRLDAEEQKKSPFRQNHSLFSSTN
jgi:hypothetical protein